jgi:hypothetical protein
VVTIYERSDDSRDEEENMMEAAKLRPEEETLLALLRRADALGVAYMAVELEEWGYPEAKAEMLETLEDMRVDALENIAAELVRLRVLKEHELGVQLEYPPEGSEPYVPKVEQK